MMTLDEAIKHCEEKSDCTECGAEHKQLAEWLRELKAMRERERNINEYLDRDMIKALRCLASQDAEGNCYEDIYNFRNRGNKQEMHCGGNLDGSIPCPYYQNKYEVCFEDGECGEWLNAVADELERLIEKPQTGWIPVEERLPEDNKYILMSFENFSAPLVGRYEEDEEGGAFCLGDEDESCVSYGLFVSAWMPLPEPYKLEK